MAKYVVTLEEIVTYDVTVEAENEEAAKEAAEQRFVSAWPAEQFPFTVHAREVANVERMSDEMAAAVGAGK